MVVLAHGINEHSGRYEHVARALNEAGYALFAIDHRGHGRSSTEGKRSSNIRRFDLFVDDYIAHIDRLRAEEDAPVIALGHSMGGLIAARAALRAQDRMAAMILTGPALKLPVPFGPIRLRVSLIAARFVPFLPLPGGKVEGEDRLSRDPAVRQAVIDDPLCIKQRVRMGISRQLYLLSEETRRRASEIRLPLLVMHGEADTITDPAGSREFVANAQSPDKEFVSWPGDRHEILNELDKDAVLRRMIEWLDRRFPVRSNR